MAALHVSELNRQVDVQVAASADDSHGAEEQTWSTVLEGVWVAGTPVGGKEALLAGSLQQQQNWRIVVRPRVIGSATHRLLTRRWIEHPDGTVLNIRSVADPDGLRERLVLLCDTGVAG